VAKERAMGDIVDIGLEPSLLSPARVAEIRARSFATARKLTDALAIDINAIVDAKFDMQQAEIAELRGRVERLERLLAPREVEGGGDG
jgi:hypothetical protein